jgi:hypothetical protein
MHAYCVRVSVREGHVGIRTDDAMAKSLGFRVRVRVRMRVWVDATPMSMCLMTPIYD